MSDTNNREDDAQAVERLQKLLTARKRALGDEPAREQQIKQWTEDVEALLHRIRGWLEPFTEGGTLTIEDAATELNEPQLGHYQLAGLDLIGPDHGVVRVRPVARFVMGAKGRVDLEAPPSRKLLVRSQDDIWQFVDPDRRGPRIDLSQASLLDALVDLLA